jgi:hypothetical protein
LSSLSWGIRNSGSGQQILIDHFTSGTLSGVPGEDIHLPPPAPGRKVVVAVLDTGVDSRHPALKDALAGTGFNAINGSRDVNDTHGHGTHVSGIIAARAGSADGLRGVSSNAFILPVKVVQTGPNAPIRPQGVEPGAGTALTESVAKGIEYAVENGAEVINLSLAWPASIRSKRVEQAIAKASAKKVVIVSSAGNDSTDARVYPCLYPEVICVGSHGPDGSFSHFSNFGSMVDLVAPGTAILSTWPQKKNPVTYSGGSGYEFRNGTSMAAPFVAGAVAELLSRGVPTDEIRARLILGARSTRKEMLYADGKLPNSTKNSLSGNLDLAASLLLEPTPLILPAQKSAIGLEWDGVEREVEIRIPFRNHWIAAGKTRFSLPDRELVFETVGAGETIEVPTRIRLSRETEGRIRIPVRIEIEGQNPRPFEVEISIFRTVAAERIPGDARVIEIGGSPEANPDSVRSVILPRGLAPEHVLLKEEDTGLSVQLLREGSVAARIHLQDRRARDWLALHRLRDGGYCFLFARENPASSRPSFFLHFTDSNLVPRDQWTLGTETTVLSERFLWARINGREVPIWVALGFTPPKDLPAFDPWNRDAKDRKMPRIFYLDRGELRIVKLQKDELPVLLLPDGRILLSRGNSYFQRYQTATIENGVLTRRTDWSPAEYRMLSGGDPSTSVIRLDGSAEDTTLVSGPSSPGDLRITGVGSRPFDRVLRRHHPLDSLVAVPAAFSDRDGTSAFVESHHDLLWYPADGGAPLSTSLNRYSYVPSFIFSRSLFPARAELPSGSLAPSIITPAGLTNEFISEVVMADPKAGLLRKPAFLRLRADESSCLPVGNLVEGAVGSPALQLFYCSGKMVEIPLSLKSGG